MQNSFFRSAVILLLAFSSLPLLEGLLSRPALAGTVEEGLWVEVSKARTGKMSPILRFPGSTVPRHLVKLAAEVGGRIQELAGEPGTLLASGTPAFRLNPETARLHLELTQAARETARRQLEEMKAGTRPEEIKRLQALERYASESLAQVRNEKKRLAGLRAGNAISNAQWDDIEFRERMAAHQLEAAQEAVKAAEKGRTPELIAISGAQLDQAQVQVRQAEKSLRDTQGTTPFTAVLVGKFREPGEIVAPGEPVVQIQSLDPMRVRFFVGEGQLMFLRQEHKIELAIPALAASFSGTLVSITPACDEATRRFPCEAEFSNPSGTAWPGLSVEVAVELPPLQGTIIPATCLLETPSGTSVFIVESDLARSVAVTEVAREDGFVMIKGVSADSVVVSRGAMGLRDGARVQVRK